MKNFLFKIKKREAAAELIIAKELTFQKNKERKSGSRMLPIPAFKMKKKKNGS
jgi:hypothetical protein